MEYPFKNLIFEGGGVKGIAYVGALKELDARSIIKDIKRVGGTSAGAINAVLFALGFTLKETLGFRLDTGQQIAVFRDGAEPQHNKIDDFFDYIGALIKAILNVQENQYLHSDDCHRTVYIDTIGVGTTDFDLLDTKKRALVKEGEKATQLYFDWYDKNDTDDNPPINHPANDL